MENTSCAFFSVTQSHATPEGRSGGDIGQTTAASRRVTAVVGGCERGRAGKLHPPDSKFPVRLHHNRTRIADAKVLSLAPASILSSSPSFEWARRQKGSERGGPNPGTRRAMTVCAKSKLERCEGLHTVVCARNLCATSARAVPGLPVVGERALAMDYERCVAALLAEPPAEACAEYYSEVRNLCVHIS